MKINGVFDLAPMRAEQLEACELVWDDAYRTMRVRYGLPVAERTDETAALLRRRMLHLLAAAMRRMPAGEATDVAWLTADQQWAMRVVMEAGLDLHPLGPLALRGFDRAPAPYLPTGAFG